MSNEVISIKTTNNFKDSVTKETSVPFMPWTMNSIWILIDSSVKANRIDDQYQFHLYHPLVIMFFNPAYLILFIALISSFIKDRKHNITFLCFNSFDMT